MSEARIRPIEARDDAAVAAIIRTVMTSFGASGPGFAIHDPEVNGMSAAYARPRAAYFVVEKDGVVLGGAGIAPLDGGDELRRLDSAVAPVRGPGPLPSGPSEPSSPVLTCELRKMYFLPEARGLGLGRAMLERCLEAARGFGYRRCYLETLTGMDQAQALYAKLGFVRIAGPRGCTGHTGCDRFYERAL